MNIEQILKFTKVIQDISRDTRQGITVAETIKERNNYLISSINHLNSLHTNALLLTECVNDNDDRSKWVLSINEIFENAIFDQENYNQYAIEHNELLSRPNFKDCSRCEKRRLTSSIARRVKYIQSLVRIHANNNVDDVIPDIS